MWLRSIVMKLLARALTPPKIANASWEIKKVQEEEEWQEVLDYDTRKFGGL
jgi:hypothetical protein